MQISEHLVKNRQFSSSKDMLSVFSGSHSNYHLKVLKTFLTQSRYPPLYEQKEWLLNFSQICLYVDLCQYIILTFPSSFFSFLFLVNVRSILVSRSSSDKRVTNARQLMLYFLLLVSCSLYVFYSIHEIRNVTWYSQHLSLIPHVFSTSVRTLSNRNIYITTWQHFLFLTRFYSVEGTFE